MKFNQQIMRMKNIFRFAAIISFFSIIIASCAKEEPEDPTVDNRDKFIGSYTCVETSTQSGTSTFTINVNKSSSNADQIEIVNFYNFGLQFKAVADVSTSTFTIAPQTLSGQQLHGNGSSTGATSFTMTYYVVNGSITDTCSATCTR